MKWFTIFVVEPSEGLKKECTINCAGQSILLDGKHPKAFVMELARKTSNLCFEAQVFSGKMRGELIATFRHGQAECSYCGKAHL